MYHSEDWPTLYQVHWYEKGMTKRSTIKSAAQAFKHMERLLSLGVASWMVPIPYEPDDLPF